MKKIISLFQRNYDGDQLVRNEVVPGAEWVLAGEGLATRKFDGTCCLFRDGKLYKRYERKSGGIAPLNFEPANEVDEITGKQQGWVPIGKGPEDQWHREALENRKTSFPRDPMIDGQTYELCGPKIQGNPEGENRHELLKHGSVGLEVPRDFNGIREFLKVYDYEGIVWHHPDGRMVKIKAKDFGMRRYSGKPDVLPSR